MNKVLKHSTPQQLLLHGHVDTNQSVISCVYCNAHLYARTAPAWFDNSFVTLSDTYHSPRQSQTFSEIITSVGYLILWIK